MKNYKQILEAVNRGIQLALDDFEDDEVQNIKSKQIQNRDYTKEYLDLMKDEVVDLGLPSKTLWCKYNLGVNPNQLSIASDWYGDYYAWGELEEKTGWDRQGSKVLYDWTYYKFGKSFDKLTKYCSNPKYGLNGFTDNLTQLLPEDDAAYQNKKFYNFKFHIPTKEQFEELIKYTNNYWINNYDPNKLVHNPKDDEGIKGLNGRIFEGNNGNQLFIPDAGYRGGTDITNYVGSSGSLWSSKLLKSNFAAYLLVFNSDDILIHQHSRRFGHSVRPVINL